MPRQPHLLSLRREWGSLSAPGPHELAGDLEAVFVAPLRRIAPAGLGLIGLPRWYGKRFRPEQDHLAGQNLVRSGGALVETLPMTARIGPSRADGRPALVVTYARASRRPWPWVRDEVRVRPDGSYLGMTYVDVPGLRPSAGRRSCCAVPDPRRP
ncbi:hypothetical protein [Nocardioides solisilvae]|uniref:hypothetical protein n=1 Tax=Nocardioides solisilvae TaxID=1542435 RepID=UPI001EF4C517|nr:hypothetical protein [Nocardioides solisilvae]